MQHIIYDISKMSETFVQIVGSIQSQIHEVSDEPDDMNSQDVLEKARQTEETTKVMTDLVDQNSEKAVVISGVVNRFS